MPNEYLEWCPTYTKNLNSETWTPAWVLRFFYKRGTKYQSFPVGMVSHGKLGWTWTTGNNSNIVPDLDTAVEAVQDASERMRA